MAPSVQVTIMANELTFCRASTVLLTDVYTLAHELGHATHDCYVSRSQTLLNINVPSDVAETASIFGELLVTDLM